MPAPPPPRAAAIRGLLAVDRALVRVEELLLAALLAALIAVACAQALLRNFGGHSLEWADVVVRHAVFFLGFLGGALATSAEKHIGIDLCSRLLGRRGQLAARVATSLFAVALCGMLARAGWAQYLVERGAATAGAPVDLISSAQGQLAIPIAFGLLALHFAVRVVVDGYDLATGRLPSAAAPAPAAP